MPKPELMISTPKLNRVLFVDDDEATNKFHLAFSKDINLAKNIEAHSDAKTALSVLDKITDKYDFPELIFVDINMPGLDGHEFTQQIQDMAGYNPNRTCVALLTSSKNINDVIQADENQVEYYYWKPLTEKTVNRILRDALGISPTLE
ncbi:MAG: response regulator [Flavobacteriales bacterium]